MERMRSAGAEITDHEHELLARLRRSALAAAASVDSEDFETLAGYGVYSGDVHWYYRMCSGMVERILQERKDRASEAGGGAGTRRRLRSSVLTRIRAPGAPTTH
jgi:hypothetical protein